jgi:hypothetical protein
LPARIAGTSPAMTARTETNSKRYKRTDFSCIKQKSLL